jgi:hypothetical protein
MSTTTDHPPEQLPQTHVRALTEPMKVYEDDPETWSDAEVAVYSENRRYLVNIDVGHCDCPDVQYRRRECKHLARARYALEEYSLPEWIQMDRVDDQLRTRLEDSQ